jgi:signal transduction histidine kinase
MTRGAALSAAFRKLWALAGAVSIRTKILGIVLALVLLLGGGVTLQVRAALTDTLTQQLRENSISLTRDLAARSTDSLLINDLYDLSVLLHETQANNPDVRYGFILDKQGQVVAHTFPNGFPANLDRANTVAPDAHHHTVALATDEGTVWDTAVPIFEGKAGTARLGLSERHMRATVNAITAQLLLTTVIVSIIGIAAATFLTWLLTRPIRQLVQATEAVRQGDYSPRVGRWADDELGTLADAFNTMTANLDIAKAERLERERMRLYYLKQIIAAQEEERKRIARELHDETGQALASLMVGLRNAEQAATPEETRRRLVDLRAVTSNTLEDVRRLALELRPSVLDDLGLAVALRRYVQDYAAHFKTDVDLQISGLDERRLSPEIETAVYRIVQEALTNVVKYAQAQHVSVLLEAHDGQFSAIVEDDGCGFDAESVLRLGIAENRLGIYGMRERAELIGGTLTIESRGGRGTTVYVRIPL